MLLLLVLVVLISASLLVMADSETTTARQTGTDLKVTLGEIRMAFDMKSAVASNFSPDLSTPANIEAVLAQLETEGLLRRSTVRDPTIPAHRWKIPDGAFWVGSANISSNTSFESTEPPDPLAFEVAPGWAAGTPDTSAATDTTFFPYERAATLDDYRDQNKLGVLFRGSGTSLRIDHWSRVHRRSAPARKRPARPSMEERMKVQPNATTGSRVERGNPATTEQRADPGPARSAPTTADTAAAITARRGKAANAQTVRAGSSHLGTIIDIKA